MKKATITLFAAGILLFSCKNDQQADDKNATAAPATTASTTTPAPPMDSAAVANAWKDYMTPGEFHKMMAKDKGVWTEEMTMWWVPGAPPEKQTATAETSMIMNGLYQVTKHKGNFNGMAFEGMSILGYDNAKQKFVSTWIDNMSSGIMNMEGDYDPKTRTITFKGKSLDIPTKKETEMKEVFKFIDDNTQMMEMYETKQGEQERKTMEIKFTRKA